MTILMHSCTRLAVTILTKTAPNLRTLVSFSKNFSMLFLGFLGVKYTQDCAESSGEPYPL